MAILNVLPLITTKGKQKLRAVKPVASPALLQETRGVKIRYKRPPKVKQIHVNSGLKSK